MVPSKTHHALGRLARRANALVAIPMAEPPIRRDLALVFRKDKALSRAALAFIEIAKKHKSSAVSTSATVL